MLVKKARAVILVVLAVGLVLSLSFAAMAQTATPSPTPDKSPQPTGTAAIATETAEASATITATAEITVTPQITTTVTAAEPVTTTEAITITAIAELPLILPEPVSVTQSRAIELTIYNQGLALVSEMRSLPLAEGLNLIRYTNIPASLDAATAFMVPLSETADIQVLEQNLEYDAPNSATLLSRYVDQEITVTTAQGTVYTGTLLSTLDNVILSTPQGVNILRMDQIQEIGLPPLPGDFVTEPTLVWLLNAGVAGPQPVRVNYLAGGIGWQADYVALLAPDEGNLSLDGRFNITNKSGLDYSNVQLKLVAADINRVTPPTPALGAGPIAGRGAAAAPIAGAPTVAQQNLFEYHLYTIQRPVTLADGQSKQIGFAGASQVQVTKTLTYGASPNPYVGYGQGIADASYGLDQQAPVQARLEFSNTISGGLGIPLPEGIVRVYQQSANGSLQFLGEDSIGHTAEGEQVSLYLGDVFDLVGERTQVKFDQLGERSVEETIKITLRNHKTEDTIVRVIEHLFRAQDSEILASSEDYISLDAHTIQYELPVKAGGEASVQYTVRYTW